LRDVFLGFGLIHRVEHDTNVRRLSKGGTRCPQRVANAGGLTLAPSTILLPRVQDGPIQFHFCQRTVMHNQS